MIASPLLKNSLTPESFYLFLTGLTSILGQVVILRELNTAFYGVELIYILSIGGWLFWTGIGAFPGKKNCMPSSNAIRRLFMASSALPPLLIAAIRAFPLLPGSIPGAYLPISVQFCLLFFILAPAGIGFGLLFQWTARRFVSFPDTLAKAYAIESLGGLASGTLSTLFLSLGMLNFSISILILILSLSGAMIADKITGRPISRTALCLFVSACAAFYLSPDWNREMIRWRHPTLTASHDTPYGRVTITGQGGQYVVFENNTLSFDTEDVNAEEIVHLAALQRPAADTVLIFGDTARMLTEILKHSPRHIDYVDPDPVKIHFLQTHLPASAVHALKASPVLIHHTDPRRFLRTGPGRESSENDPQKTERSRLTGMRRRAEKHPSRLTKMNSQYDLILSGMPDPSSGAANRFFTLEFFKQCRRRLTPGGILAFRFHASENLWTRSVQYRNASIMNALNSVFPHVMVTSGLSFTVLASTEPLLKQPEQLIERLQTRKLQTRLFSPEYIRYLLTGGRFRQTARMLRQTPAPVNSDRHPVCYSLSAVSWLTQFAPSMINADVFGRLTDFFAPQKMGTAGAVTGAFFALCFFFLRRSLPCRRLVLAWTAGFTGMSLETLLLLYYQSVSGILFQNIGILIMAFMGGLAAGSLGMPPLYSHPGRIRPFVGPLLTAGMICLNLFCLMLFQYDSDPPGFFLFFLMLFLIGALSAGLFSYASIVGQADQKAVISPLYSADLMGGCMASLLTSLILIPVLGMSYTIGFIIILSSSVFLLVI